MTYVLKTCLLSPFRSWAFLLLGVSFLLLTGCVSQGPVFPMISNEGEWQVDQDQIDPLSDRLPALGEVGARFRLVAGDQRSLLIREDEWAVSRKFLLGFDVSVLQAPRASDSVTLAKLIAEGSRTPLVAVQLDADAGITVAGKSCVLPAALGEWHRIEVRVFFAETPRGYVEVFCDRKPVYAILELETGHPPDCGDSLGCGWSLSPPVAYSWKVGLDADRPLRAPVDVQLRRMQQRPLIWTPNRVRG